MKLKIQKTVKYHVPNQGIYLYGRECEGKNEMIILNSTNEDQIIVSSHYNMITGKSMTGVVVSNGEKIDFRQHICVAANASLVIEF